MFFVVKNQRIWIAKVIPFSDVNSCWVFVVEVRNLINQSEFICLPREFV